MIDYTARSFFWCGQMLRSITADCMMGSVAIDVPIVNTARPLDDAAKQKALGGLGTVVLEFRKIGMAIAADMTQDLVDALSRDERRSFEWLLSQIETIERVGTKELNNRLFLYIPPERAKYWPTVKHPHLFGQTVANKFPSATFDITSAGFCLASGMSTAAVFHLMRVMEIAIGCLGKVFNVSFDRTNWTPAIAEIEKKIRNMHDDPTWKSKPDWREQRDFYSDAATNFTIIKDAWRNHAMHARAKYSDDEAERIFASVKAFTRKLAERLSE